MLEEKLALLNLHQTNIAIYRAFPPARWCVVIEPEIQLKPTNLLHQAAEFPSTFELTDGEGVPSGGGGGGSSRTVLGDL